MKKNRVFENVVHGIFLLLGLITVGCVLLITVYLIISGIPAIKEIGLVKFLFGKEWASTAAEPKFGILPFILTSVYGTAGAILIGVPVGFFTAVFLSKVAGKKVRSAMETAVSLLAASRRWYMAWWVCWCWCRRCAASFMCRTEPACWRPSLCWPL